jgi:hypothetical protein
MTFDHGILNRMQTVNAIAQVFDGNNPMPMYSGQERDTGVYSPIDDPLAQWFIVTE